MMFTSDRADACCCCLLSTSLLLLLRWKWLLWQWVCRCRYIWPHSWCWPVAQCQTDERMSVFWHSPVLVIATQSEYLMIILTTTNIERRELLITPRKEGSVYRPSLGPSPPSMRGVWSKTFKQDTFIGLLGPFLLSIKQDTPSLSPRLPCYCPISYDNKIVNINFESDCPRRVFDVNIRIVKLVWWSGDTTCGRIFHSKFFILVVL